MSTALGYTRAVNADDAGMGDAAVPHAELTALMRAWQAGDGGAGERLFALVYPRVRAIAAQAMRGAQVSITPTELAHEALLRLIGDDPDWEDRRHFFHVVAQATRQILVDRARRRLADKRGAGQGALPLSAAAEVAANDDDALLRVNQALDELGRFDARRARIVELVYFGGFSRQEIARALDVSEGTVDRDLRFARAWLKQALVA